MDAVLKKARAEKPAETPEERDKLSDEALAAAVLGSFAPHEPRAVTLDQLADFLSFTAEAAREAGLDEETQTALFEAAARVFLTHLVEQQVSASFWPGIEATWPEPSSYHKRLLWFTANFPGR